MSITVIIIIITGLISYQCFNDTSLKTKLMHYPVAEAGRGEYWRLLTAGFVHADWIHLGINMFVLYSFGEYIEGLFASEGMFGPVLGKVMYAALYLLAVVAANLTTFAKHKDNPSYSAVGASGAISAVLFVFVMFNPWNKIYLYGIIGIYSIVAAIAFLVWESYAGKKQIGRTDHDGHLFGALFGVVFIVAVYPKVITIFLNALSQAPFL